MNIAIIDDELHCVESLVIHINTLFPEMRIVYKTTRPREVLDKLPKLDIDLLFLDIEMPGFNGFQLLDQLPEHNFDVIFTTAYSQYAIQAFRAKAVNYLLKPIDEQELKEAVLEWQETASSTKRDSTQDLDQLLDYLKKEGILKSKISVPVSDGYEFLEIDKIMYCRSQSNYTTIFLANGNKALISKTLKEVENMLSNFFFIRIHQSYLINPNYLKKYNRNDGGYLIMENDEEIPVSTQKRKLIKGLFDIGNATSAD